MRLYIPLSNTTYDIGVCRPVRCGTDLKSGVCQRRNGADLSLGTANNYPLYLDGDLTLVYGHGAPCSASQQRANWTANIEFACNVDATSLPRCFICSH